MYVHFDIQLQCCWCLCDVHRNNFCLNFILLSEPITHRKQDNKIMSDVT